MPFGIVCTVLALCFWGAFPLYFHALQNVGADEILAHRIVWSMLLVLLVVMVRGRLGVLLTAIKSPKTLGIFTLSSILVAANWGIYVYSITSGHTLEASLGYFINPLFSVALGAIFLHEKLRRMQLIAIALACLGVLWVVVQSGIVPWLGLGLALTWCFYGLIRKLAPLGSLEGMTLETAILFIPAIAYLGLLASSGNLAFASGNAHTTLLLLAAGPVTAVPLLLFTAGVRAISYSTVGVLQYLSPSIVFLIGLFVFHEPFSQTMFIGFFMIWCAVAMYLTDLLLAARCTQKSRGP